MMIVRIAFALLFVMGSLAGSVSAQADEYVLAVRLSSAAYEKSEKSSESKRLVDEGWMLRHYETVTRIKGQMLKIDAQYLTAYKRVDGKTKYCIAFRATDYPLPRPIGAVRDWLGTDFNAKPVLFYKTGTTVHNGFFNYTQVIYRTSNISDLLEQIKRDPNADVLITGHSLGGAVAVLFAAMMIKDGFPETKIHVITFGQPQVGKRDFAEQYGSRINLVRFTRGGDYIVTGLGLLGYVHTGKEIVFPGSLLLVDAHIIDEYMSDIYGAYAPWLLPVSESVGEEVANIPFLP